MLKRMLLSVSLGLGSGLVPAQEMLKVYGWEGRLAPGMIEAFEKHSGIKVQYSSYASSEGVLNDAGADYDLLFPSHFHLPALIDAQRLQPLDLQKLPNLKQVDPDLLAMLSSFDGKNRYAVPHLWGTVGLALNVPKIVDTLSEMPEDTWGLLFDTRNSERLRQCGIGLLDAREETLSLLLNYKGRAMGRSSPRQIQQAGAELLALRSQAASFGNNAYIEQLANGKLCIAIAWSGHALTAAGTGAPLRFVIPREGALMFIDTIAIPSDAANVVAAHRFIDYLLGAEANIRNARNTLFYPVIRIDSPAMTELAKEHLDLVITGDQRRNFYYLEALSARQKKVVDASWAQTAP